MGRKIRTTLPLLALAVEQDGFHLMTKASANGQTINLLIDTGASRSVFDNASLERILQIQVDSLEQNHQLSAGIGTNQLESRFLQLHRFRLGDLEISDYQAVLIDMGDVNRLYTQLGLPAIEGILGGDILKEMNAIIDYGKLQMTLTKPPVRKAIYSIQLV